MRKYLKILRKGKGLTQIDVSQKLDIGTSTYAMVELGERQKALNLPWIEKLSNVFDVPVNFIISEEKKYQDSIKGSRN